MKTHTVVAAWLHVAAGLFVLVCTTTLWMAAAMLAPMFDGSFLPGLVALVGRPVAVAFLLFGGVELVAAVALLRGRGDVHGRTPGGARVALIVISVLLVPVFPIGTAVALYTLWALLYQSPAPVLP